MIILLTLLTVSALHGCSGADERWVWGSGRNAKLAKLEKGRYGVFEPDIPEEPYSPPVRPPPKDLPPLIRPGSSIHERPFVRPTYENRPERPYRPYEPRPYEPQRPYERPFEHKQPYVPTKPFPERPLPPHEHREEYDPTKFEKCKCTHSFNCKSPGIVFGNCGEGKKYCCEKFINNPHRRPGGPINDLDRDIPEVLAGPGGPVDHIYNNKRPCTGLRCYTSEIQGRRP